MAHHHRMQYQVITCTLTLDGVTRQDLGVFPADAAASVIEGLERQGRTVTAVPMHHPSYSS